VADLEFNASYDDSSLLNSFLDQVDVVTAEFENIPGSCLEAVEARRPLRPGRLAIHTTQHRQREKEFLRAHGIACAPFEIVNNLAELDAAVNRLGRPCVVKTAAFGYDGKGQSKILADTDLTTVWQAFEGSTAVLEKWISFDREISVVGARALDGSTAIHGVIENYHHNHILDVSLAPARVSAGVEAQALQLWHAVAEALDYVGTMAVELFVTAEDQVMVNEIAPRPHNSGHHTIDACRSSQFYQQLRAICGLPLGDPTLDHPVAMVNLLGDIWPAETTPPDWSCLLSKPEVKLHLYGKHSARPGRKMGHFTILAEHVETAAQKARELKLALLMPG
jgi:5-(carboxyamino)imidazole ribonucleotide synthase